MKKYFQLLRIKHYIKNLLIFFPLFFSQDFFNKSLLLKNVIGFMSFCFLSSAVYIINDLKDAERDKRHPRKCKRPIASGEISKGKAGAMLFVCLVISIFLLYLCESNIYAAVCVVIYLLINIVYSSGGKNIPVWDIVLLGTGYFIRVLFGGFLVGIKVSLWLFLTVLSMSFYLGFGKRKGEMERKDLLEERDILRPVLNKYSISYINSQMYLCLGLGIVFYSLWAIEKRDIFVYTVPVVMIICMKYNLIISEKTDGDPVETVLSNKELIILVAIYCVIMTSIIYFL